MKDATSLTFTDVTSMSFNPRVREGRDIYALHAGLRDAVSIHASVKDATRYELTSGHLKSVSIHASVKDATK